MSSKYSPTGPQLSEGEFHVQPEQTPGGKVRFRLTAHSGGQLVLNPDRLVDLTNLLDDVCDAYADRELTG